MVGEPGTKSTRAVHNINFHECFCCDRRGCAKRDIMMGVSKMWIEILSLAALSIALAVLLDCGKEYMTKWIGSELK